MLQIRISVKTLLGLEENVNVGKRSFEREDYFIAGMYWPFKTTPTSIQFN